MDKNLIERYKKEMLKMYHTTTNAKTVVSSSAFSPGQYGNRKDKKIQSENKKNSSAQMNKSEQNTEKSGFSSPEEMRRFMGENDDDPQTDTKESKGLEAAQKAPIMPSVASNKDIGYLIANVTALKSLYPVANAKVTIFTGPYNAMDVVATHITNANGKTQPFDLYAPPIVNSLRPNADGPAYAEYNMLVQADGYIDNIHLKIPIFKGVTSIQPSNMVLLESSKPNVGPNVFDSSAKYDL